jgi:hypothetical protein
MLIKIMCKPPDDNVMYKMPTGKVKYAVLGGDSGDRRSSGELN